MSKSKNVVALSTRRELSPTEMVFMEYESQIYDLVRAVGLDSLALAADEDAVDPSVGRFTPIALEHLKERAERLQQKWCADHARLFKTA